MQFKDTADSGADTSGQVGPKSKKPHSQFREQRAQSEQSADNGHIGGGNKDGGSKPAKKPHSKFREYSEQLKPSDKLQPGDPKPDKKVLRESRGMEKSKFRMEKTGGKLEKAVEKRNKKKPPKNPGAIRSGVSNVAAHGRMFVHRKIHEAESENTGVESAHRAELVGERVGHGVNRFRKHRARTRPARRMKKIENRAFKAKADFQYRKMVQDHPELKKNALSKYLQKRRLKKRYQKQAREAAKKSAKAAKKTAVTTGKVVAKIGRAIVANPKVLLIIGIAVLLLVLLYSCMGAVSMIGNGMTGGIVASVSYLAEDEDIDNVELAYTEWETDLQLQINNMETTRPGYHEYRYNVGHIGHSPFELMGFLTAVYNDFTYSEVEGVLKEIFDEHYTLTTREITETRTETRTIEAGESIGQKRITGYCACEICCGQYAGGPTASGVMPKAAHTIAVDARNPIVPIGTKVVIEGVTYTVEDTGNLNINNADFDIFFDTHAEALAWGRKNYTVYMGEEKAEVTAEYQHRILEINLAVRPFSEILMSRMNSEQQERYAVLLMTKGARQYIESLFTVNWLPNVTSNYGYRVHPIDGTKDLHRGADIAFPEGYNILAGFTGTVTFAANNGDYGLVVVIDDGDGLVAKYAHCSELLVSEGQTVQAGHAIAKVGSTGSSTGPHLHIEVLKDGQYLNPLFFAVTNDNGI